MENKINVNLDWHPAIEKPTKDGYYLVIAVNGIGDPVDYHAHQSIGYTSFSNGHWVEEYCGCDVEYDNHVLAWASEPESFLDVNQLIINNLLPTDEKEN